jgi:mono/diheme cytochrome c family protein
MTSSERRRWARRSLGFLIVAFIALQLIPYGHTRSNPPVLAEPTWDSPATRALAKQACFDCHSNETEWPLYARVAPVSWLIQRDVVEGREHLNFSEWHRPQREAAEAAEKVLEGDMPLGIYRLMHSHARLSDASRQRLARGLEQTLGPVSNETH